MAVLKAAPMAYRPVEPKVEMSAFWKVAQLVEKMAASSAGM